MGHQVLTVNMHKCVTCNWCVVTKYSQLEQSLGIDVVESGEHYGDAFCLLEKIGTLCRC